jgi:hypothetical protein
VLNTASGSSYPFALQNDGDRNTLYRTDLTPWARVGTTTTPYATPDSLTVTDKQVFILGYETPRLWNGTTLSLMTAAGGQTVPPGAKHGEFHLSSIWVWNTSPVTTALDGPSSLRMSDANNPNSWPNANQAFIAKDDGQVGMGLSAYTIAETGISPTATLIAFKNYSAYQINGVFGALNFSVQRIKSDMGCLAPRSIQFVSGFGVIRLTHKGFALYDGVNDRLISEEIRPAIFGHHTDATPGINFQTVDRAWASQSQNPPLYVCAVPTSGSQLDRVFIYDLIRKAWTICDYPFAIQTLALITTPTTQPLMHAGTTASGTIKRLFAGDHDDDGVEIPWSLLTRTVFLQSPQSDTFFRRVILDLAAHTPQTITVTTKFADIPPTTSALVFNDAKLGSSWGRARWGQFAWGGGEHVHARRTLDILRTTPSMALSISGTGHCVIRGLTWHARAKPLTRMLG